MDTQSTEQKPEAKDAADETQAVQEHHEAHHHEHAHQSAAHHSPQHKSSGISSEMVITALKSTNSKAFFTYLLISLVMFWTVTLSITSVVVNGYGDVHQSLFNLWWVPYSLFTLHQSPYFTSLLYYPIGANLATQTLSPIAGILIAPIYALSAPLAYNVLFFLGYALSGLFMFMLARYITKNNHASFIAGLIFTFSPVHVAQSVAHLDWTMIEWIPAFTLLYLMAINEKKMKYAILAGLCFVLLTFMGDIQQGLMTSFFALILTVLILAFDRQRINLDTFKMIGTVAVTAFIISIPFLILLVPYINSGSLSVAQQNSEITSNMQWSDNLASFFLPSYYNGLFNGIAASYESIYQLTYQGVQYNINIGERVSYLGYSVLALAALGIYYDYRKHRLKNSLVWLVILIFFIWLATGPYLQVGGTVTGIPGPYMLFRDIPILNIIREPGRLDFIATLALAIIAALGFSSIASGKDRSTSYKYMIALTILILIEYNGMPLTSSYISNSTTSALIPKAYYQIGQVGNSAKNFSVLILPAISIDTSAPNEYTGTDTYYVTAMKKPIIGGYTSRENDTQSLAVSSIPLAETAWYLEQGAGLVYPSPINENYSNVTLLFLAKDNTSFISIITSAYNLTELSELYSYLNSTFGSPAYLSLSNHTIVFYTVPAIEKYAGRSLVSYTIGTWIPGYDFCTSYASCSQNISDLWWGPNTRGIVLYSPADERVKVSMIATSPINGTPLQVYLNGNPEIQLPLQGRQTGYTFNMTVPQGFSEIILTSPNSTEQIGQYFAYGVKNLTFTA